MPNRSPEDSMQDIDKRSVIWIILSLQHWKHLCSCERITQNIYIPSKIPEKISLWRRCSSYLNRWYWNIRMRLCVLWFCVMSWTSESEPNIKYCLGRTPELVQEFITIQSFVHNWRGTDGIGVEYFPGFTALRCSMTWYGELKTMNGNARLIPHLCLHSEKETKWFKLTLEDHEENGTESLNWWWSNSEMADTQFSEPRVHCPEERSKSKEGGKLSIHFCADGETIETVFRTISSVKQLSIYGAVSDSCDEYRACQARTTERPVLAEHSDPLFEPASFLMTTPTHLLEALAQDDLLQKFKERVERLSQQNRVIKICTGAGFLENSWSRNILHDKNTLTSSYNLWTEHPRTSHFLVLHSTHFNVARDIGSTVLRARHPCIIRMVLLSWHSSTLHSALFTVSLIFFFIFLIFIFVSIFHVGWFGEEYLVRFREWEVRHSGREESSQVMSPTSSTEIFIHESSSDSRLSNLHDLEIDDFTIGRALSSPLFTQEREDPASRRQACHSPEESLLSSQSLSVGHLRIVRPVSDEFGTLI